MYDHAREHRMTTQQTLYSTSRHDCDHEDPVFLLRPGLKIPVFCIFWWPMRHHVSHVQFMAIPKNTFLLHFMHRTANTLNSSSSYGWYHTTLYSAVSCNWLSEYYIPLNFVNGCKTTYIPVYFMAGSVSTPPATSPYDQAHKHRNFHFILWTDPSALYTSLHDQVHGHTAFTHIPWTAQVTLHCVTGSTNTLHPLHFIISPKSTLHSTAFW